jgi:hypothetical protein
MSFPWDQLKGTRALLTFFSGAAGFSYCEDGNLYRWNGNVPEPQPNGSVEDIDRICFHDPKVADRNQDLLLSLNTIKIGKQIDDSGGHSGIKFENPRLTLNATLRCFLQGYPENQIAHPYRREVIFIRVNYTIEGMQSFWLSHSARIDETEFGDNDTDSQELRRWTGQNTLAKALSSLDDGRTQPIPLGRRAGDKRTDINTEQSRLLRGLLSRAPSAKSLANPPAELTHKLADARLTVTFRRCPFSKSGFPDQKSAFVMEMESRFGAHTDNTIRCLSIRHNEDDAHAPLETSANREWVFRQRSSAFGTIAVSRTDLEKITPAEWVLELSCLSHASVSRRMTEWTGPGAEGLKSYSGATGASFLPTLDAPVPGLEVAFAAVYGVADRVHTPGFVSAFLGDAVTAVQEDRAKKIRARNVVQPWSVLFMQPDNPEAVAVSFALCQTTMKSPLTTLQTLSAPPLTDRENVRGFLLFSTLPLTGWSDDASPQVRMGSLELGFGKRTIAKSSDTASSLRIEILNGSPHLQASAAFCITRAVPGGQDDIPTDSFLATNAVVEELPCRAPSSDTSTPLDPVSNHVEKNFYRPRPILINRGQAGADAALLLRVDESSGPQVNRTLRMGLKIDPNVPPDNTTQQVIVLDSDPFLVAQISFPPLVSISAAVNSQIATWDNASGDGSKWQIPVNKSTSFRLTLPPQAIGEEMIKNQEHNDLPFDFRLGTPATVAMKTGLTTSQGDFATGVAEVPWNLRRVLGYAGQPLPGVSVDRLDYELVYGLSCDVSQPYVRLAETFALLGAVTGRLPRFPSSSEALLDDPTLSSWGDWRTKWSAVFRRYQSRLAILEPSDQHVAGSLTLKHGMSCMIRYNITAATANACSQALTSTDHGFSFPPDLTGSKPVTLPVADLDDPIAPSTGKSYDSLLRGGVTWGFESRNIFCATLRNEFSVKDSAAVSDLELTALGGFGHQQASFDEGRTSIFADVAMGRTYYYKLERLGRLCTLWNKAKHVIVYERSVVPSRQFYQEQNPPDGSVPRDYGVPVLRKVEEYVEVLEDERRFPDDHLFTAAAGSIQATPDQRCGCLVASVFPKNTKIHVSGSWGSDVNSTDANGKKIPIGWKIPLWKRGATPADVYPFPKASLSMLSQFGDNSGGASSKESPCDIANPDNLYFYTDTRPGTGSDSDAWGAIVGLDTVDMPQLQAPLDSKNPNPTMPAVGDTAVPAGFSPCTFTLLPPLRPANIVANRGGNPIAAALESVTMLRGFTGNAAVPAPAADVQASWTTVWTTFISGVAPSDWTSKDKVQAAWKALAANGQPLDSFAKKLNALSGAVVQANNQWKSAVQAFNKASVDKFTNQLLTATSDGQKIAGGIKQVLADVQQGVAQIKAAQGDSAAKIIRLRQLAQEQFAAVQHAVMDTSATPGVLTSLFSEYLRAGYGIINSWQDGLDRIQTLLNTAVTSAQAALDLTATVTQQALSLRDSLNAAWASAAAYRTVPELADIATQLQTGVLKPFKDDLDSRLQQLANSIQSSETDANERLKKIRSQLDDLIKNYRDFSDSAKKSLDDCGTALKQLFKLSDTGLEKGQQLISCVDRFRAEMTQVIPNVNNWASKTLNDLMAATNSPDALLAAFTKAIDPANSTFQAQLKSLSDSLVNEEDTLRNKTTAIGANLCKALDDFKGQASDALTKLQDNLKQALDTATGDLKNVVAQFRDSAMADLNSYLDRSLPVLKRGQADITAGTNQLLSLARCFGAAPAVDNLTFFPGKVGYYLAGAALSQVDLSPVSSTLQQAGNLINTAANDALSVMKLQVPAVSLGDRLIPPDLSNFKLSDIFPRFSGIDLSNLFKDINLGENGDKIKIRHGVDPQSRSAWVEADVGAHLQDVPVFEASGVSLRLATADFTGQVRMDASPQGTHQLATGNVVGDWKLLVIGQEVVTLSGTQLLFDNTGKLRFIVKPENVRLPGALQFVTEYLASFGGNGSGLSIKPMGTMLYALLDLPIPDMQGLTSGFSNLSLACKLGIGLDGSDFKLDVEFGLSSPDKPFNVAVFVLGGAGYILASTSYKPGKPEPPVCSVNFGIMASASLAIALGPISGGVYVFLGIRAAFSLGGPGLNLSAVLLIRGQVNIAGIISASVCLELTITDENGHLTGRGHFSISITICWCFTLNISTDVTFTLGSGGSSSARLAAPGRVLLASNRDPWNGGETLATGGPHEDDVWEDWIEDDAGSLGAPDIARLVADYVKMTPRI